MNVDVTNGWVTWELLNDKGRPANKDTDTGRVDPRNFEAGLEPIIQRLATTPEPAPADGSKR